MADDSQVDPWQTTRREATHLVDAIGLRHEVTRYVAKYPTLIATALADADEKYFLARCASGRVEVDQEFSAYQKSLQITKKMTDKPSRDALIFRHSYFFQVFAHRKTFQDGVPYPGIQEYLHDVAARLDQKLASADRPPAPPAPPPPPFTPNALPPPPPPPSPAHKIEDQNHV